MSNGEVSAQQLTDPAFSSEMEANTALDENYVFRLGPDHRAYEF